MLTTRIATAAILALLIVGSVLYLPPAAVAILLGGFLVVAGWEWSALIGWSRVEARISYSLLLALLAIGVWQWNRTVPLVPYLQLLSIVWWSIAAVLIIAAQLKRLGSVVRLATNGAGGLMVLLPAWSAIMWLLDNDRAMLLIAFALIWIADGAAFFVGKRWGQRRLASNVSPGKTWEGAAGGVGIGAVCAVILSYTIVLSDAARVAFIFIAVASICVSVVGDLFESMLKRRIGVKDSGQVLPGHGGVMDRIDGLVAFMPIFVAGLHYWVNRL